MFDRMGNGWAIAQQSWQVLRKDKEMLVFPILSGLACLIVLASFVAPLFLIPGLFERTQAIFDQGRGARADQTARVIGGLVTFTFYFLNYFVIVFFNTALVACAVIRFKGGDPTVSDGLRVAGSRMPQILGWALLASTVGMILNAISERSEWLGKIVIAIIGTVWTIATYLVVPTLAVEGLGPVDALKRSARLISEVWGEGLTGNFGLGLIGFLLTLPVMLLVALGVIAVQGHVALMIALIAAGLVYLLTVSIVMSAMKQIFIAGLYLYATEKKVPEGFSSEMMRSAFRRK